MRRFAGTRILSDQVLRSDNPTAGRTSGVRRKRRTRRTDHIYRWPRLLFGFRSPPVHLESVSCAVFDCHSRECSLAATRAARHDDSAHRVRSQLHRIAETLGEYL